MSEISLFAQEPLVLLLKIKKIQNNIKRDDGSGVLFAGLDDCATQLELFSTQALSAQNEREGIGALRNAYMKVASTRYYFEVLYLLWLPATVPAAAQKCGKRYLVFPKEELLVLGFTLAYFLVILFARSALWYDALPYRFFWQ